MHSKSSSCRVTDGESEDRDRDEVTCTKWSEPGGDAIDTWYMFWTKWHNGHYTLCDVIWTVSTLATSSGRHTAHCRFLLSKTYHKVDFPRGRAIGFCW